MNFFHCLGALCNQRTWKQAPNKLDVFFFWQGKNPQIKLSREGDRVESKSVKQLHKRGSAVILANKRETSKL